jgi:tRNA threonylcarbamoyladenosine biosynthesis protein TsaE
MAIEIHTKKIHQMHGLSQESLRSLAHRCAQRIRPPAWIGLSGDIGAGKTYFASAWIQYWNPLEIVTSPTFTLLNAYDTPIGSIWHGDLYRLTRPEDCLELECLAPSSFGIHLIEWPERMGEMLPESSHHIQFSIRDSASRDIELSSGLSSLLHDAMDSRSESADCAQNRS